ncbi:hypothetical protein PybrP1_006994 [[Pythium] brassicae (nom. inval.)]|nr:hypothetical protein PybrP1_006994 [[Pythium] brassicae (nom. inval.)]
MSSEPDGISVAAVGDDELELDTGRSGVDELLESMFTERTAISEDSDELVVSDGTERAEHQLECEDGADSDDACHPEIAFSDAPAQKQLDAAEEHEDADISLVVNAVAAAAVLATNAGGTTGSSCSPGPAAQPPAEHQTLRVIAFDVGGKLFRCKESLIRKHPRKRLCQVISCGCERIGEDTFFIDRNPQNFEVILDWYRTGLYVRHPHVDESAMQEDAKYFDLFEELFPEKIRPPARVVRQPIGIGTIDPGRGSSAAASPHRQQAPRVPPRPQIPTSPEKTRFSESRSPSFCEAIPSKQLPVGGSIARTDLRVGCDTAANTSGADSIRFCRTEHRKVAANAVPVVFMLRENDQLLVASVAGRGKLLVRVCDATGMRAVLVETAVLFDSQSWFYLQGGRAKLEHCLLPGSHTYTFWMEEIDGSASKSRSVQSASSGHSRQRTQRKISDPELEVEFKIISRFRVDEQCPDQPNVELQTVAASHSIAEVFPGSSEQPSREGTASTSFSPYMFLPLRLRQPHQHLQQFNVDRRDAAAEQQTGANPRHSDSKLSTTKRSEFEVTEQTKDRDAIAKQLFVQAPSPLNQESATSGNSPTTSATTASPAAASDTANKKSKAVGVARNAVIKRGGAAVVSGSGASKVSASTNISSSKVDASTSDMAGRITVYRAAQLKIEDSPRRSPRNSNPRDAAREVRESTRPTAVATKRFASRQTNQRNLVLKAW